MEAKGERIILVRKETNPDDLGGMLAAMPDRSGVSDFMLSLLDGLYTPERVTS